MVTASDESASLAAEQVSVTVSRQGSWRQVARTAIRLRRTQIGLGIVTFVVIVAVLGPAVAPYSPTAFEGPPYSPPSSQLLLGTDYLGRDVLSRLLHGGTFILAVAAIATVIGVGLGTALGMTAGYVRGLWDDVIMRTLDVVLCFPAIVFALLLVSVEGPKPWLIVLAVAVTHAPQVARVIRGATVQLIGREFIGYAEGLGSSNRRIVFGEILPNVTSPLAVEFGLRLTYSIGIVASLGFLGFGQQPPAADWGLMINENRGGIALQPWGVIAPVVAIALVTIGANLVTDGVARAAAGIDRALDIEPDTTVGQA